VEAGRLPRGRLDEAAARVAGLLRWAGPPPDPRAASAALRTAEHLALAEALGGPGAGRDPTGG
jgi:hypothetical protein